MHCLEPGDYRVKLILVEDRSTRIDCVDFHPVADMAGACCLEEGACSFLTAAECAALGGIYQGDNVFCDPNPCQTPLLETSWGRIRFLYR